MVWIHGGGNLGGAGSAANIDGEALARRGVVVVTINYRLGVFGFLADPGMGANFAVQDQVAALRWVSRNIADFGGDRRNVTAFGQSAGAVAVHALLSCPSADGLYHRAIVQSAGFAPAAAPWWSYGRTTAATRHLFKMLGSTNAAVLRTLPTSQVQEAGRRLSGAIDMPGYARTPTQLVWTQTIDGEVLRPRHTAWATTASPSALSRNPP
jgi:para-nitrobenzyl esterase